MIDQSPNSILVVDDDKQMRQSLLTLLEAAGWQVECLSRADLVLDYLNDARPDVILSDVRMPGMSGLELLAALSLREGTPPLVLISAHGDIPMAVQAVQDGAYSFLEKPYEPRRLLQVLQNAAERARMRQSNARLTERLMQLSGLDRSVLGQTAHMEHLRRDILNVSDIGVSVLLKGATGTGKDLVARALHDLGPHPDGPFLALNCAALSEERFEAEMFGVHGKNNGQLRGAVGGTLYLDEICACPLPVQAKLLRVIEEKEILPIGAPNPIAVDFRVLSSTNVDPEQAVAAGDLRADLFYRLNTVMVELPPLRRRRDDIALLARHFLNQAARVYDLIAPELSHDDLAALLAHDWPGNVRELRHACERRCLTARRGGGTMMQAIHGAAPAEDSPTTLREAVASFERELIAKAIRDHHGRMDDTADALGIGRRTLNEKIVKLGLDKDALL